MSIFYLDPESGNDATTNTPLGWWSVAFTGGTAPAPAADETVTGATSGKTAKVTIITLSSGTWAGNDAAGTMYFYGKSGTFVSEQVNGAGGGHFHITADFTYCAWKTITSGATAARIAAGDTIRIKKSPDVTSLGVNGTWTAYPTATPPNLVLPQPVNIVSSTDANPIVLTLSGKIKTLDTTPTAGGSGYTLNDVLTITGGVSGTATCTVDGVSGGSVTSVSLTSDASTLNANNWKYTTGTAKATSGGTGSGCTVNITATDHALQDGDCVIVSGHTTNTPANGQHTVSARSDTTISVTGVYTSSTYGAGGATGTVKQNNYQCCKLSDAFTLNVANGTQLWGNGTSVTVTNDTSVIKTAYYSTKIVTGTLAGGQKLAYSRTLNSGGSGDDYSSYQQISFWFRAETTALTAGQVQIKFCTDTAGATPAASGTFNLPAIPIIGKWQNVVINAGANLPSGIKSVAIYSTIAMTNKTFYLDGIFVSPAASSDNSLTLMSLISKNSASQDGTGGFYAIQSVSRDGLIVRPDQYNLTTYTSALGSYISGTSTAYKRETFQTTIAATINTAVQAIQDSGSAGSLIAFEGGYNTSTNSQDGETYFDGNIGYGFGLQVATQTYTSINYLNFVRYNYGIRYETAADNNTVQHIHDINNNNYGIYIYSSSNNNIDTIYNANNNYTVGIYFNGASTTDTLNNSVTTIGQINNNSYSSGNGGLYVGQYVCELDIGTIDKICNNYNYGILLTGFDNNIDSITDLNYNGSIGLLLNSTNTPCARHTIGAITNINENVSYGIQIHGGCNNCEMGSITNINKNGIYGIYLLTSSNNNKIWSAGLSDNGTSAIGASSSYNGVNYFRNISITGTDITNAIPALYDSRICFERYGGTANNHYIVTDGGTISSADGATYGHTASGICWKLSPTSTNRNINYPLTQTIAHIACSANNLVTIKAWVKKTHATDIGAKLICSANQLAGIGTSDITATKTDDTNWEELSITFTPTEAGVVEIKIAAYWAANTADESIYVDDMTITQA